MVSRLVQTSYLQGVCLVHDTTKVDTCWPPASLASFLALVLPTMEECDVTATKGSMVVVALIAYSGGELKVAPARLGETCWQLEFWLLSPRC